VIKITAVNTTVLAELNKTLTSYSKRRGVVRRGQNAGKAALEAKTLAAAVNDGGAQLSDQLSVYQ